MQIFEARTHLRFVIRMSDHFVSAYPPDEQRSWGHASEAELQQRIIEGTKKSKAYGLITETAQFDYLVCQMELGDNFDNNPRFPWANAILNDKDDADRNLRLNTSLQLRLQS
ncbi:hypothetical protein MNBD_GAMMA11-836 [hydrothermal vent metagenome]|uniref:Uncharacterized protein n=1 Tax=hydrothermal vent metagenome TaxID=652676 RepID=A0A3B0X0E5_9ZZZZ